MDKIEGIFQTPLFKTKLENTHGLALESNRILPLFEPASSSSALTPFDFYHGDHFVRNDCE